MLVVCVLFLLFLAVLHFVVKGSVDRRRRQCVFEGKFIDSAFLKNLFCMVAVC